MEFRRIPWAELSAAYRDELCSICRRVADIVPRVAAIHLKSAHHVRGNVATVFPARVAKQDETKEM